MSTKDHILDVAERRFAESGIGGTSLRRIMAEARVNPAAVHYHFGGKESLLDAVITRRLAPVTEARLARLEALEALPGPPQLEALIEAYVEPALRLAETPELGGAQFLRLMGRVHSEAGAPILELVKRHVRPVIDRFAGAFRRAAPDVDPIALAWRTHFLVGAMAHTMTCRDYVSWIHEAAVQSDLQLVMRELVAFATAGLRAQSVPQETRGLP